MLKCTLKWALFRRVQKEEWRVESGAESCHVGMRGFRGEVDTMSQKRYVAGIAGTGEGDDFTEPDKGKEGPKPKRRGRDFQFKGRKEKAAEMVASPCSGCLG